VGTDSLWFVGAASTLAASLAPVLVILIITLGHRRGGGRSLGAAQWRSRRLLHAPHAIQTTFFSTDTPRHDEKKRTSVDNMSAGRLSRHPANSVCQRTEEDSKN